MGLLRRSGGGTLDALIVGLGNPGRQYARHAPQHRLHGRRPAGRAGRRELPPKYDGRFAETHLGDARVALLEPETFMNLSGRSVAPAARFYKLEPAGRDRRLRRDRARRSTSVRAKAGGGLKGHNGLRSMADSLGTPDFLRVRCGVGRPRRGDPRSVADFVLGRVLRGRGPGGLIERAADCAEAIVADGIDEAERRFASSGRRTAARRAASRRGARRSRVQPSNAARPRGIEQLPAALARVRRRQHHEAAQHRSRDERPGLVMGLRAVGHRYDRSVTRHPAPYVNMAREVREALVRGQPVVALETTYVSHGFPHPTGVETAVASEDGGPRGGGVPATIALMDGEIRVGLRRDDLDRIALEHPRKVSPRDLAATLADGALGATTVAGTIAIARLCGIHHAATGGIGGVHRDAERTFDVSADLTELARAQVCLVCSGAKSILDVPRTLEVLETLGMPVVGFGTSTLPLFYCRESEHDVPARVDTADAGGGALPDPLGARPDGGR